MAPPTVDFATALNGLASPFILLVGSYVSNKPGAGPGPGRGIAPIVPIIKHRVLSIMKSRIDRDRTDPTARLIAALTVSAASPHRWAGGILNDSWSAAASSDVLSCKDVIRAIEKLKYEEFMRRLAAAHGAPDFIDRLVGASYTVPAGSFNINHSAIAHLLRSGACFCVLTTNFDNAIENACAAIGFNPSVLTLSEFKSNNGRYPAASDVGPCTIFKLHGCALRGGVVANSTEFHELAEVGAFKFVEHLLRRHPTATLGYSGYGDIDIAPHVVASGKGSPTGLLIFTDRKPSSASATKNPFPHSRTLFVDLDSDKPSDNLLLGLCQKHALVPTAGTDNAQSEVELEQFVRQYCSVEMIKTSMIDLPGVNYPTVKLYYWFGRGRANKITEDRLHWTDPRMLAIPLNNEARREIAQFPTHPLWQKSWHAFVDWRLAGVRQSGTTKAVESIREVLEALDVSQAVDQALAIRIGEIVTGASAESLWATSRWGKQRVYASLKPAVELVRSQSKESWWSAIEAVDVKTQRELRLIEIDFLLGVKSLAETKGAITDLFERASNLMLLGQVRTIIRSAWLVERRFGNELLLRDRAENRNAVQVDKQTASVKKDMAHWLYRLPLGLGLLQYIVLERLVPRLAEPVWHWWSRRWGAKVAREVKVWMD